MKTTDLIKDLEPDQRIVKFAVVKKREESHAAERGLNALLKR